MRYLDITFMHNKSKFKDVFFCQYYLQSWKSIYLFCLRLFAEPSLRFELFWKTFFLMGKLHQLTLLLVKRTMDIPWRVKRTMDIPSRNHLHNTALCTYRSSIFFMVNSYSTLLLRIFQVESHQHFANSC